MNKKILISLSVIAIVAAIGIGGTIAYFHDTETSTGNIFVAGSIDLKVDHIKQTYNDIDCQTCSVEIYSSPSTTHLVAASGGAAYTGPFPVSAVDVTSPHPNWVDENLYPPAQWIWATDPTDPIDTMNNVEYTFQSTFDWQGPIVSVNLDLGLAADNGYAIYLNETEIVDKLDIEHNFESISNLTSAEESTFSNAVVLGENILQIIVRNHAQATGNPAGLLYFLEITSDCDLPEFQAYCTLFGIKDLEQGDYFWRFDDVKPGDHGTNVISLHVDNNDAYVCLINDGVDDQENVRTETEIDAGDTTDTEGELSDYLELFIWNDSNGNGEYEPTGEVDLYEGGFLPTGMTRLSLSATSTDYLGVAWCMGTQTIAGDGTISCSGSGNQDQAQTDRLLASLILYAEQQRNNSAFDCSTVILP